MDVQWIFGYSMDLRKQQVSAKRVAVDERFFFGGGGRMGRVRNPPSLSVI